MDQIEHVLGDFGRGIIDNANLSLTQHQLAQVLTKTTVTLHIDIIGSDVDRVLRPLEALVFPRGGHTRFRWQSGIWNCTIWYFDFELNFP